MLMSYVRMQDAVHLGEEVCFLLQSFQQKVETISEKESVFVEIIHSDTSDMHDMKVGKHEISLRVAPYHKKEDTAGTVVLKTFRGDTHAEEISQFLRELIGVVEGWRKYHKVYVNTFVVWKRCA